MSGGNGSTALARPAERIEGAPLPAGASGDRLSIADMQTVAQMLAQSGYFSDARQASQAFVKVLAGRDLGLPPFVSMTGIHIVQGKPVLGAGLIGAIVKRSGVYNYRVTRSDETACEIEWFERGEKVGVSRFTVDEAKRAGLAGKDNWRNYAEDMLFARALTRGARRYCPDVFSGSVYAEGEIIEGMFRAEEPTAPPAPVGGQPDAPRQAAAEERPQSPATTQNGGEDTRASSPRLIEAVVNKLKPLAKHEARLRVIEALTDRVLPSVTMNSLKTLTEAECDKICSADLSAYDMATGERLADLTAAVVVEEAAAEDAEFTPDEEEEEADSAGLFDDIPEAMSDAARHYPR